MCKIFFWKWFQDEKNLDKPWLPTGLDFYGAKTASSIDCERYWKVQELMLLREKSKSFND